MKNKIIIFLINILFSVSAFSEVKIAVIDNFESYHGNAVYEIIQSTVHKDSKISKFQFDGNNLEKYYSHLEKIRDEKFDIVNLSFGSSNYDLQESLLLRQISENGTLIVVAAGNDNTRIEGNNKIYPCSLKIDNLYCIGAGEKEKASLSNYGFGVTYFMSGKYKDKDMTSFSAPRFSSLLSFLVKMPLINRDSFLEACSSKVEFKNDTLNLIDLNFVISNIPYYQVAFIHKGPI